MCELVELVQCTHISDFRGSSESSQECSGADPREGFPYNFIVYFSRMPACFCILNLQMQKGNISLNINCSILL